MMIQVTCSVGEHCLVNFKVGRKGKNSSYDLTHRGHLVMPKDEWELLKRTLERGASRPVIVVIDEVEDETAPEEKQPVATGVDSSVKSPF